MPVGTCDAHSTIGGTMPTSSLHPRVLVAEDDAALRSIVSDAFRRDGFDVTECKDGQALLRELRREWLAHEAPDLIVTDVRMPGYSGLEAVADLRWFGWRMPVVVATGFGAPALRQRAGELRAFVVDKPFRVEDLRRLGRSLVNGTASPLPPPA